jgi:hypothetical protein
MNFMAIQCIQVGAEQMVEFMFPEIIFPYSVQYENAMIQGLRVVLCLSRLGGQSQH